MSNGQPKTPFNLVNLYLFAKKATFELTILV
jgi:hypothetical protein